jgi:hypothetical protein
MAASARAVSEAAANSRTTAKDLNAAAGRLRGLVAQFTV